MCFHFIPHPHHCWAIHRIASWAITIKSSSLWYFAKTFSHIKTRGGSRFFSVLLLWRNGCQSRRGDYSSFTVYRLGLSLLKCSDAWDVELPWVALSEDLSALTIYQGLEKSSHRQRRQTGQALAPNKPELLEPGLPKPGDSRGPGGSSSRDVADGPSLHVSDGAERTRSPRHTGQQSSTGCRGRSQRKELLSKRAFV